MYSGYSGGAHRKNNLSERR